MKAREFYEANRAKVLDGLRSQIARGSSIYVLPGIERPRVSWRAANEPLTSQPIQRFAFHLDGHIDHLGGIHGVIRCDGEIMEAVGRTGYIEELGS